jgi:aminoglycoside phosphotransferase (APT) family kinase protein
VRAERDGTPPSAPDTRSTIDRMPLSAASMERRAVVAACRVATRLGYEPEAPVVLRESNNTVVWLRPHAVVAKVGKSARSVPSLMREHAVGMELAANGAAIAPPVSGAAPTRDEETDFLVTLWERLEGDAQAVPHPEKLAASLRDLHEHLMRYSGPLPSYQSTLDLARTALFDDEEMRSLRADDLAMLRTAFDRLDAAARAHAHVLRPLHGEAHDRNVLVTPQGLKWIDFEGTCLGPPEWDLAFLPEAAANEFPEADRGLLDLLRTLNSARVATWCFVRWHFPELRWHAQFHLEQVRRWFDTDVGRRGNGDRDALDGR